MEEQNTTMTSEDTKVVSGGAKKSKSLIIALVTIIAAALVVGWYMYSSKTDSSDTQAATVSVSASDYPAVVAVVNGEELSNVKYARSMDQILRVAVQQGVDTNDIVVRQQVESQAMDTIVNTALLMQAAVVAGVSVDDSVVSDRLTQMKASYPTEDDYNADLDKAGLTEDSLKADVRDGMIISEYLGTNKGGANIAVSDDEVKQAYDNYAAQATDVPALETVSAQIKQQLLSQKQQEFVDKIIQELRAAAKIEIKL